MDMKRLFMMALVGSSLLTAAGARADYAVKVECWGSSCMNVQFRDICNYNAVVSVSCAQTANPATGDWGFPCAGATCQQRNWPPSNYDYLGAFCNDTGGYDALVICRS
jgi:hypothetical protein